MAFLRCTKLRLNYTDLVSLYSLAIQCELWSILDCPRRCFEIFLHQKCDRLTWHFNGRRIAKCFEEQMQTWFNIQSSENIVLFIQIIYLLQLVVFFLTRARFLHGFQFFISIPEQAYALDSFLNMLEFWFITTAGYS